MTDYDEVKALRKEADGTNEFLRSTYSRTDQKDFFKIAVLRSLAIIIKLLVRIVMKG